MWKAKRSPSKSPPFIKSICAFRKP
ncbi:hypothetical protein DLM77_05410 [Leptospira yasudae]|uniref:Uncharacterized protein n=1 Tax=Leptospira yasudae TaxID=2202201 RepID=A0ABX9M708_9LEPT|nr:hypothetical protein DLM77_05410 [Leptospira yasudae]